MIRHNPNTKLLPNSKNYISYKRKLVCISALLSHTRALKFYKNMMRKDHSEKIFDSINL